MSKHDAAYEEYIFFFSYTSIQLNKDGILFKKIVASKYEEREAKIGECNNSAELHMRLGPISTFSRNQ